MSTVTEETSETTEPKTNKWVYLFDEGPGDDKALLGGKGAGLCEMTRAGLPVPPGLVVTTEACNAFFDNDKNFPEGMWEQVKDGLKAIETKVGKQFGGNKNPLLVSARVLLLHWPVMRNCFTFCTSTFLLIPGMNWARLDAAYAICILRITVIRGTSQVPFIVLCFYPEPNILKRKACTEDKNNFRILFVKAI